MLDSHTDLMNMIYDLSILIENLSKTKMDMAVTLSPFAY